ncbi:hypothetical protein RI367_006345 [Sorochytrium milnesiophthora]
MDKVADAAQSTRVKRGTGQKENPNEPTVIGSYKIDKTLGQGTYGKVKLGIHLHTNEKVAIKIIEKANIQSQKQVARIQREIRFLKLLHHPHIVKVFDVLETPEQIFIIMEHIQGGELFDYIVTHKRVKEKEARAFYRMILSAVDYCHKNAVIHRDLKPENLLLDSDKTIKIIDFGFGNTFKPHGLLDTFCGSPFYAAPEMILGKMYEGPEVDMWSLGVILFALLCGHLPFDDENVKELYRKIASGTYTCPSYLSPGAKQLIQSLITVDPKKRATLRDAMQSPWVNEGYSSPPQNFLPERPIIQDPTTLNKDLVTRLQAFGFAIDDINKAFAEEDPTKPHPIRATYFLLQEMLQREDRKQRDRRASAMAVSPPASTTTSNTDVSKASAPASTARVSAAPALSPTPENAPLTTPARAAAATPLTVNTVANAAPAVSLYSISEDEPDGAGHGSRPAPITAGNKGHFISMPQVSNDKNRRASAPDTQTTRLTMMPPNVPGSPNASTQRSPPMASPVTRQHGGTNPSSPSGPLSPIDEKQGPLSAPVAGSYNSLNLRGPSAVNAATHLQHAADQQGSSGSVASGHSGTATVSSIGGSSAAPSNSPNSSKSRRFSLVNLTGGSSKRRSSSSEPGNVVSSTSPPSSAGRSHHDKDELRQINGWFLNVSTTSSKTPVEIIAEVTRVLRESEVTYTHNGGYTVECRYRERPGPATTGPGANAATQASQAGEILFEIEICKVPRLNLFGLHFKRLNGGIWNYKKICNKLLAQMSL